MKYIALKYSTALDTSGDLPQYKINSNERAAVLCLPIHCHKALCAFQSITIFQAGITASGESSAAGMIFSVQSRRNTSHVFNLALGITSLVCCRGPQSGGVAARLGPS